GGAGAAGGPTAGAAGGPTAGAARGPTAGAAGGAAPLLDALAEAQLVGGPDPLRTAAARLRHNPAGDTLIVLTGPSRGPAQLDTVGTVAALRGRYPSIVVGALGATGRPDV